MTLWFSPPFSVPAKARAVTSACARMIAEMGVLGSIAAVRSLWVAGIFGAKGDGTNAKKSGPGGPGIVIIFY
jgi:hypothetical protein